MIVRDEHRPAAGRNRPGHREVAAERHEHSFRGLGGDALRSAIRGPRLRGRPKVQLHAARHAQHQPGAVELDAAPAAGRTRDGL